MTCVRWACSVVSLIAAVVRGAEVASPGLQADAALQPAVGQSLRIQAVRDTRDKTLIEVMIQVDRPPVAMGFDVSIRAGDKTVPVGPMAWGKDIQWWAYNVDVPVDVTTVDFIFTANPNAVVQLRRIDEYHVRGIDSIWDGQVVVKEVNIREQRLAGMIARSPPGRDLLCLIFSEEIEGRAESVARFRKDGDIPAARAELERLLKANPGDVTVQFNLGCVAAAEGDWQQAVENFGRIRDAQPNSALADKAQRQLRRIGGYLVYSANREVGQAMFSLGLMYDRAWGPARDRQTAKRWYRNAANAGHAAAMTRLGALYAEDLPSQQNTKAQAWYREEMLAMYRKAAELGDEEARRWRIVNDQP